MGSDTKPKVASVYEETEEGERIPGTKKNARIRPSKPHRSERLEKPEERRKSKSDTDPQYDAMMTGARVDVMEKLERRKSMGSKHSPRKSTSRPPSSHGNKAHPPKLSIPATDHPSHFGYGTPTSAHTPVVLQQQYAYPVTLAQSQPIPLRPKVLTSNTYPTVGYGSRPSSYHPPISASAFYHQPLTPSYPPPSPSLMHYAATPEYQYAPQPDYFAQGQAPIGRSLLARFESPVPRTASAASMRPKDLQRQLHDAYEDGGYVSASELPKMRNSIREHSGQTRIRTRKDIEAAAMPPPQRPGILRNRTAEYHADIVPEVPRESRTIYRDEPAPPRRRSSVNRHSVSYDRPEQRVEMANTSHRRSSYYGPSPSAESSGNGSGYEEKLRNAAGYQEDVGGPTTPLSAESLRRHRLASGSSRSSGSRDESDYRKSATTHTSQSGRAHDENFTVRVKSGQARIMVGSTQIDCTEGDEVEVQRQKSIGNGSERSSSHYGDDRKSRTERPAGRSRMSSQSGRSYERTAPRHAPQYAPAFF